MGNPWTPGPWAISGKGSIRGPNAPRQILGYIARVNWQNRDANARLIAEAPAMAEALEMLVDFARNAPTQDYNEDRVLSWIGVVTTQCDAILARIKGETP